MLIHTSVIIEIISKFTKVPNTQRFGALIFCGVAIERTSAYFRYFMNCMVLNANNVWILRE